MRRVFVVSNHKKPLMPCHPARARELLSSGQAALYRAQPFTIILKARETGDTQNVELKIDPGSKTSGIALVAHTQSKPKVIFAAHLEHRGQAIKDSIESRRALRRSRRARKTRYRQPRFNNRIRPKGWLPPSLQSRVDNVACLARKLSDRTPITSIEIEIVRFDTQKLQNPEISGTEYQQGTLAGYEAREYLLEKWLRKCAYCDAKNVPLEREHIVPKSKGGSDRISNSTLACRKCNQSKGNLDIKEFVGDPKRLKYILGQAKAPLKDAAAVNATRFATGEILKELGFPVNFWTGGRTKFNRCRQAFPKEHWIDAACVGITGSSIQIPQKIRPLEIKAQGRGTRQKCRVNRYGFPRTRAKSEKRSKGFQTGDLIIAKVSLGKKKGRYRGRVAVRKTGNFNIKTKTATIQGISHKYCKLIQRDDGYCYNEGSEVSMLSHRFSPKGSPIPPPPEGGGFLGDFR